MHNAAPIFEARDNFIKLHVSYLSVQEGIMEHVIYKVVISFKYRSRIVHSEFVIIYLIGSCDLSDMGTGGYILLLKLHCICAKVCEGEGRRNKILTSIDNYYSLKGAF